MWTDDQEESRQRHDQGADNHHRVNVCTSRQPGNDWRQDENQDRVDVGEKFEVFADHRAAECAVEIVGNGQPDMGKQRLYRYQDKNKEGEPTVTEGVIRAK